MNEYNIESQKKIDVKKLEAEDMPTSDYAKAHRGLVIVTHDVVIEYNGGALLVLRNNVPGKNELMPVGGRIKRGIPIEESLRRKVKEECNLEIDTIIPLGMARTRFATDPFGHGHGTDSLNLMFYAKGSGIVKLDALHSKVVMVKPEDYTTDFKKKLHPYTIEIMDKAMPLIRK